MALKPQDIFIALKLLLEGQGVGYASLANFLGMSASEVHAGVGRLGQARLLMPGAKQVRRQPLCEFILHGLPYVFPAHQGEMVRGMPTAWAAPVFGGKIVFGGQPPPVWPDLQGTARGEAVEPLYRRRPGSGAARSGLVRSSRSYRCIADRARRERSFAADAIAERFKIRCRRLMSSPCRLSPTAWPALACLLPLSAARSSAFSWMIPRPGPGRQTTSTSSSEWRPRSAIPMLRPASEDAEFDHDVRPRAPKCRWVLGEVTVSIMPTDGTALGLNTLWFNEALSSATEREFGHLSFG